MRYATRWRRLWAAMIDMGVFTPMLVLYFWIVAQSWLWALVALVSTTAIGAAYAIVLHGLFGQTLGKMAMHTRVVQPDGSRITMKHALVRWAGRCGPNLLTLFFSVYALVTWSGSAWSFTVFGKATGRFMPTWLIYLGDGWFLADGLFILYMVRRRAIHDLITGTVVVDLHPKPMPLPTPDLAARRPALRAW